MLPRPVVIGLVILVAIVWAANVVVGYLVPDRNDPAINAIFAAVMSGVYALGRAPSRGLRRTAASAVARIVDPSPEQNPPDQGATERGDPNP